MTNLAFVSTNSIFQGEQASFFLNNILNSLEISFAYPSFSWSNSAKNKAGVTVAIVGISRINNEKKKLFKLDEVKAVDNINVYLKEGPNFIVNKRREPLSRLPKNITKGSAEFGEDNLLLTIEEKNKFVSKYPESEKLFKKLINATDIMNGTYSFAIWINDEEVDFAMKIPEIKSRIEKVKYFRENTKGKSSNSVANKPWRFGQDKYREEDAIVMPVVSSESRDYIPVAYMEKGTIATYAVSIVYNAPIWLIGIIGSRMHNIWLREVGGKLKTDYRYSAGLVYNTFPIPELSDTRKNMLEEAVFEMLDVREEEGGTLAELYGGANKPMNERLRQAHEKIDGIVERAYQQKPFESDEERLSVLLNLYKEMTEKEAK